jgi:hypothetical protein
MLSDQETDILKTIVELFGWDKTYFMIVQQCFAASLSSALKSNISFAFFLLTELSLPNSEHSDKLLNLCFDRIVEVLTVSNELIPSGIDLIATYCKDQNLIDRILNAFQTSPQKSQFLKEMEKYITSKYSFKDLQVDSLLYKIIKLRLKRLRKATASVPKFSWEIKISYPSNKQVETFFQSSSESISISGFSGIAGARKFIESLGLTHSKSCRVYNQSKQLALTKYLTAQDYGVGTSAKAVLKKTRFHFSSIEQKFNQCKVELQKLVRWLGAHRNQADLMLNNSSASNMTLPVGSPIIQNHSLDQIQNRDDSNKMPESEPLATLKRKPSGSGIPPDAEIIAIDD